MLRYTWHTHINGPLNGWTNGHPFGLCCVVRKRQVADTRLLVVWVDDSQLLFNGTLCATDAYPFRILFHIRNTSDSADSASHCIGGGNTFRKNNQGHNHEPLRQNHRRCRRRPRRCLTRGGGGGGGGDRCVAGWMHRPHGSFAKHETSGFGREFQKAQLLGWYQYPRG
jgi:hypothetical protein